MAFSFIFDQSQKIEKNGPSSIRRWDSNSQSIRPESPTITSRSGLPPSLVSGNKDFLNWPTPSSFSFIFDLLKQTIQFLQQTKLKMSCPSCRRDLNPQPLKHELSPITTRPGLKQRFAISISSRVQC